jgi:ATPase subunit of ABC transporter with duplicated ATPase domains
MRVPLAQALFGQPQALLDSRPTTDLDSSTGSGILEAMPVLIVISHDRHF